MSGSAVGSLLCGFITKHGRWNGIILCNFFSVMGTVISLFPEFWSYLIGRFLFGISVGGFTVFCPIFINETSPDETRGHFGAITQVAINFGILWPTTMALFFTNVKDQSSRESQVMIFIILGFPVLISVL